MKRIILAALVGVFFAHATFSIEGAYAKELYLKCGQESLSLKEGYRENTVKWASHGSGYRYKKADATVNSEQVIIHGWGFIKDYFGDEKCTKTKRCNFDMIFSRRSLEGSIRHDLRYVSIEDCYEKFGKCRKLKKGSILKSDVCLRLSNK